MAVTVKLSVLAVVWAVCVPVIVALPTPLVKVNPAVTEPVVTANEVASVAVKVIVLIAWVPSKLPKLPDDVVQAGASETVSKAVELLTALPSLFSILIKYVPSVGKVNVAVIDVALVNVILSAAVIAPVELIASTWGTLTKFVPVIVIAVAVLSITVGDIDEIVGLVSPTVTLPPKETAEPFIVIDSFAILALVTASSAIFAVVMLLSNILAVVIALSTTLFVVTVASSGVVIYPVPKWIIVSIVEVEGIETPKVIVEPLTV